MASSMPLPKTSGSFIWHFIKQQKWGFAIIQFLAVAWSLDNTVWPLILRRLIDTLMGFSGDKHTIWQVLLPLLIIWASTWIIIDIMFRIQGYLMARVFPRLESHIRMAMFNYVQNHSYHYFSNHFAGNLSNRISDMTQSATRILQLIMTLFMPVLFALIITMVVFYRISPWFCLLIITWALLHLGLCLGTAKHCAHLSKTHATARSVLTGNIVDIFTNIINVKLFARQRYEYQYVHRYQKDERKKNIKSLTFAEHIKLMLTLSAFIIPGVLMTWYIIYSWQQGLISLGSLVLIFNITWGMQHLVWYAGHELPNFYKEIGICQQAMELIHKEHDIQEHGRTTAVAIASGQIEIDDICFSYMNHSKVFNNLSLSIAAGSKVGLVGFSGSGKSTFVNLLMRFFDIESGTIRIDDVNINDMTIDSLRQQISMIPQNPSLFHRSLRDNIQYGKLDADEQAIIAAAKHAHCHEFIKQLPEGYDAMVGERGIKLSGGQRQRVAIARAILENAPILILDEATSALDSVTEKHIQDALHYLMRGRTTLVIAHRLSTLAEMDRILVFDNGQLIEDGNHQTLLNTHGHYATMWAMQAGGFLPDQPDEAIQ